MQRSSLIPVFICWFFLLAAEALATNATVVQGPLSYTRLCDEIDIAYYDSGIPLSCRVLTENFSRPDVIPRQYLNVFTWNIARGNAFEQQIAAIKKVLPDVDVILLSEVDRECARSGGLNIAREYAQALQMNYAYFPEYMETHEGRYVCEHGNAILSKYPLQDIGAFFYESQSREGLIGGPRSENRVGGRSVVYARLKIGRKDVYVYSTHLAAGFEDESHRWHQTRQLVNFANARGKDVVVGGDLNNFFFTVLLGKESPVNLPFRFSGFKDAHDGLSDRSTCADPFAMTIDFIYYKGSALSLDKSQVCAKDLCYSVSDHLGIWSRFYLNQND
jgi:endonuclease/exonuclease/phosphatase family metal-dependent hydrolase